MFHVKRLAARASLLGSIGAATAGWAGAVWSPRAPLSGGHFCRSSPALPEPGRTDGKGGRS